MIMDEVLAVGDAKFQSKCLGKMSDKADTDGRTILYVSHNMSTIRQLCTRCIVLDHGQVKFDGDVEKAIEIYLGLTGQFIPVRDFRQVWRKGYFGNALRINEVEFLDTEDGKVTNEVKFRVNFTCGKDVDDVRARAEIRSAENFTVGTAPSETLFTHLKAGKNYNAVISASLPDLMPGRFSIDLLFYNENEFGNTITLDRIENALSFEISEAKILRWVSKDRGYIKFPDMNLIELKEDVTTG